MDFSKIKAGDQVYLCSGSARVERAVLRATPTLIILINGFRYRRADGLEVGHARDWSRPSIKPVNQQTTIESKELCDENEAAEIAHELNKFRWGSMDLGHLRKIKSLAQSLAETTK